MPRPLEDSGMILPHPERSGDSLSCPAGCCDPFTGMEFVFVPGGEYEMGDQFDDGYPEEQPVHQVRMSDFWIGKYPVTQGEWVQVMNSNPSMFKEGPRYPVETVSWFDCLRFIGQLNMKTGKDYRLPTEAEWEYAARSGGKREKWAGTSDESRLTDFAWSRDSGEDDSKTTHPVGEKKPNGLGLFDMSGNVWEWCQDRFDEDYCRASPVGSPQDSLKHFITVFRGGAYDSEAKEARVTCRNRISASIRLYNLGFRLVRPFQQLSQTDRL